MKKNNLIITLLLLSTTLFALDIENTFINMPNALLPVLKRQQRMELIEYYKADSATDSITNVFGKESRISFFDKEKQHLKLQTTPSTTFELFIFQLDTTKLSVIGVIRTVCAPVCHSSVVFYDSEWRIVPTPFVIPKTTEWVDTDNLAKDENASVFVQPFLAVSFISLQFDAETATLAASNNNLDFLNKEEREKALPFVKQEAIKVKKSL